MALLIKNVDQRCRNTRTFNGLQRRFQIIEIMEEQLVRRGDAQPRCNGPGIYNAGSLRHLLRWMRLLE